MDFDGLCIDKDFMPGIGLHFPTGAVVATKSYLRENPF